MDERQDTEVEDVAPSEPAPLTPRQRATRRRRRRRVIGTFLFIAVAVGVVGAAYLSLSDSGDGAKETSPARTVLTTTTTAPKVAGPYRVTTGVNIRQGPGTTFPTVGTVETGHMVFVACVVDGESVDGPAGPSTKWVRIVGLGPTGYLTVQYVALGDDLANPQKIPVCPTA